jgi:hypothetical protein
VNWPIEDVLASTVTTDKADCSDCWMITDGIDGRNLAVNNVQNTIRQTCQGGE